MYFDVCMRWNPHGYWAAERCLKIKQATRQVGLDQRVFGNVRILRIVPHTHAHAHLQRFLVRKKVSFLDYCLVSMYVCLEMVYKSMTYEHTWVKTKSKTVFGAVLFIPDGRLDIQK